MESDDRGDFEAAIFRPLEERDAVVGVRLAERFLERLVADMSATERAYGERWKRPRFEVVTTPRGRRVLAVSFGGGRPQTDRDGSEANAEEIIDLFADIYAYEHPMENLGRFGVDEFTSHYLETTTFQGTQNFSNDWQACS